MDEQLLNIIERIATVGIPSIVTIITAIRQSRQAKKHAAKQSILQMIMEDMFGWEAFRKLPTNYGDIQDEYEIYHKNGGNGEVTKRVKDYNDWYLGVEDSLAKSNKANSKGGKR